MTQRGPRAHRKRPMTGSRPSPMPSRIRCRLSRSTHSTTSAAWRRTAASSRCAAGGRSAEKEAALLWEREELRERALRMPSEGGGDRDRDPESADELRRTGKGRYVRRKTEAISW